MHRKKISHLLKGLAIFSLSMGLLAQPRPGLAGETDPLEKIIVFYQEYLSQLDMSQCPSFPSCSQYAREAIRKHGALLGWIMIVDRLIHEGREEEDVSGVIIIDGKARIYDPVQNNDFWWFKR